MDMNQQPHARVVDPLPRTRWETIALIVLIALSVYLLLFGLTSLGANELYLRFCGVGDVFRAKDRIAHCRTKDEIRAILREPRSRNEEDTVWLYYQGLLQPGFLEIRFDAQGRPIETKAWLD